MTDRELLELAAKAAGYSGKYADIELPGGEGFWVDELTCWNPLQNDGDALRLVVKLGLAIHVWSDEVTVLNCANNFELKIVESMIDGQTAVRRAIVRAAAEIGR